MIARILCQVCADDGGGFRVCLAASGTPVHPTENEDVPPTGWPVEIGLAFESGFVHPTEKEDCPPVTALLC